MEDVEETSLSPHLDDIEKDFSKDIPSHIRDGSMEGDILHADGGSPLMSQVSTQVATPAPLPKVPAFSPPSDLQPVALATTSDVVISSKSLPSFPATSLHSSCSFAKSVAPIVRVSSSDSQPKKKVMISLANFSFNDMPTSLGSAQSVSTAPVSKVVGPPPSSPDRTVLGNIPSSGDMDLGGAPSQDFSSVPSSSTMSSLHRGEGSVLVPHARSQATGGCQLILRRVSYLRA
ncbi:uncharacterized protein LOC113293098 [Papaver somniferum]|uniref:uncharacterized protein LOC113293098 n=1 Tax=Papaver somniferum TaxID=3469 RepID=UPI000E6F6711|nr:uncharacterized protein LOC113293098 [Papaver somniferum]